MLSNKIESHHCNAMCTCPWIIFHKEPEGKTEIKGKLWQLITTKPENITHLKDYVRVLI